VSPSEGQRLTVDFTLYRDAKRWSSRPHRVAGNTSESTIQQMVPDALCARAAARSRNFLELDVADRWLTAIGWPPSPNGQIYWSNNVIVDGASHFRVAGGGADVYSGYALESIREVRCHQSVFGGVRGSAGRR